MKRGVAMDGNVRVSSSVVSHAGDAAREMDHSFFVNGRFSDNRMKNDVQVSVESIDDLQVFAVYSGMELGTGNRKSSMSVSEELKRFVEKNRDQDNVDDLLEGFYELVDESGSIANSMSEDGDEDKCPTFAGMLLKGKNAGVLSMGDTRIYRLRNGSLKQLTADHRKTERLLKLGIITDEQAEAISDRFGDTVDGDLNRVKKTDIFELNEGDVYVFCSSGALDCVDEDAILYVLSMDDDTGTIACTLMDEILKKNSADSTAIQVIRAGRVPGRAATARAAGGTGVSDRYVTRRPRKTYRANAKNIRKAARLVISTVVVFAVIFGLLWTIQRLLFSGSGDDRQAAGTTTSQPTSGSDVTVGEDYTETETNKPATTQQPTTTSSATQSTTSTQPTGSSQQKYVVKSGDTLMSIARKFYDDASKYTLIQEANGLDDPDHIEKGQELVIPEAD